MAVALATPHRPKRNRRRLRRRTSGRSVYAYVEGNPLSWIDPLGLCKSYIQRVNEQFAETNDMMPGLLSVPGVTMITAGAMAQTVGVPTLLQAGQAEAARGLANYAHVATGTAPGPVNWAGAFRGAALNAVAVNVVWGAGMYAGSAIYVAGSDAVYGAPSSQNCGCEGGGGR